MREFFVSWANKYYYHRNDDKKSFSEVSLKPVTDKAPLKCMKLSYIRYDDKRCIVTYKGGGFSTKKIFTNETAVYKAVVNCIV